MGLVRLGVVLNLSHPGHGGLGSVRSTAVGD
jgi:hypothetical protein